VVAIKMVLDKGHCECKEFFWANTQVASRFLASLLDNRVPKAKAKTMMEKLFRKDLLGGIDILKVSILGKGAPRPCDMELVKKVGEVIKICSFLLDLKGLSLVRHKMIVVVAVKFLKQLF
jgi:hypothetical protein